MNGSDPLMRRAVDALAGRRLPDGGFGHRPRGAFGVEATAWAILALADIREAHETVSRARKRLAECQLADGRVPISPERPEAHWPTPLAAMAWQGSPEHRESRDRAVRFLLSARGRHFVKTPDLPVAHDPSLEGWPWTENAHSMVEPSAMALLALATSGRRGHDREGEAVRMLLDRQLEGGGWNHATTAVYGVELDAQPDVTGLALSALAGRVPEKRVRSSLGYLQDRCREVCTPLSLGWICLGLGAWRRVVPGKRARVARCLERERPDHAFGTADLSILVLGVLSDERWPTAVFREERKS